MVSKKWKAGGRNLRTEYLLRQQVGHVLAALTPKNRLVCEVMLHTGLRVGDVLSLRTQDLAHRMWVRESKTGKRKQVGLPGDLLHRIQAQAGEVWAFPGRDPRKHHTRQAVWQDVKRAAKAFRLPQNAGSHSMRKVYAVELMARYGDIDRVRRALNHDRMSTTLIYAMADRLLEAKKGGGGKEGGVV